MKSQCRLERQPRSNFVLLSLAASGPPFFTRHSVHTTYTNPAARKGGRGERALGRVGRGPFFCAIAPPSPHIFRRTVCALANVRAPSTASRLA